MEDIIIEKTSKTPAVHFNYNENRLEIAGVSIPEDADSFYNPLMEWIESYVEKKRPEATTMVLKLIYFNTSTSDYLVTMLKNLKKLKPSLGATKTEEEEASSESNDLPPTFNNTIVSLESLEKYDGEQEVEKEESESEVAHSDHPLRIEWYYEEEDEDMRETGSHFESIIDLPFVFHACEEIN